MMLIKVSNNISSKLCRWPCARRGSFILEKYTKRLVPSITFRFLQNYPFLEHNSPGVNPAPDDYTLLFARQGQPCHYGFSHCHLIFLTQLVSVYTINCNN